MAGTVQVTFGANIQPLVDGVESAKSAIESFMAAFAVDRIADFIDTYGKLGEQIERSSAMLGASVTSVQQLGYIAKLTGGDTEGLSTLIERLQLSLQRAQNPTSQQALALQALGLSAKQLIGVPLDAQLDRIADAVSKFADGGNKTAIVMALLGRGAAQMIPVLDGGSAGLARMREQALDTGAVMSGQTVAALSAVDRASIGLKSTLSTLSGEVVALASKGLIDLASSVTQDAASLTKLIESGNLGAYVLRELRGAAEDLIAQLGRLAVAFTDTFTGQWGAKFTADMTAADAIAEATHKKLLDDLAAMQAQAGEQYDTLIKKLSTPPPGVQAPSINVNSKDQAAAAIENINTMVAAQDRYYAQQADHINALGKQFGVTEAQKTAMLIAAVNSREAMETNEVQMGLQLQGLTAAQYEKFQDELTKIHQKADQDRQKIEEQAIAAYQKDWTSALNTIESSFNSQLKGLLAGTTSWQQAWKSMLGDMIIKFIEMCEQMVVKWTAAQLAQTTATVTGAAARTAAENSASAAGVVGMLANAIKAIATDAAQAFGGVFAFLAPAMGPAAAGPAAAASATVLAAVPSLDVGTDYVTRGGLAMIHAGERITPAQTAGPYSGGQGGGTTVHAPISITALDSRSVKRFFDDNAHHMVNALNRGMKRGAHLATRMR